MLNKKFDRLINRRILTEAELNEALDESRISGEYPEEILIRGGIPKHEVLFCLSEYYGYPFVEYDESVIASYFLTMRLDMEGLKNALWFPLSVRQNKAEVIAYNPYDPAVVEDIKKTLKIEKIDFVVALPFDLVRIIEHNFDVNPHFPSPAGRTPLAKVRTFLADRRSMMACYRTSLAKGRTGLAFTRSGIAFIGLGIALLRQFHEGPWTLLDAGLILIGAAMAVEGFHWYMPGRRAGIEGFESVQKAEGNKSIWDQIKAGYVDVPPVRASHAPGIWATTGLALERTMLADRRNVMARLRTVMARSRTGMAFIRTGMAISAVGIGLLVYFGTGNKAWTIFDVLMIVFGLIFITDGLYWNIPAEKVKRQFPYCFGEMEIVVPDYGKTARYWRKAIFSHDDL
jgi:uncharacterized membrane protein YidH (DUF202 family)